MKDNLRILDIEDNPVDSELIQSTLAGEGVVAEFVRVDTKETFMSALDGGGIDLIISDFTMPGFDGLSALMLASKRRPDIPFLFVSGTLGEEIAVTTLQHGATDYVLKHRMSRLAPAVQRALREARE